MTWLTSFVDRVFHFPVVKPLFYLNLDVKVVKEKSQTQSVTLLDDEQPSSSAGCGKYDVIIGCI